MTAFRSYAQTAPVETPPPPPQRKVPIQQTLNLNLTPVRPAEPLRPDPEFPSWYRPETDSGKGGGRTIHVLSGRHPLGRALSDQRNATCGTCVHRERIAEGGRCLMFDRSVHGVDTKARWRGCESFKR